MRRATIRRMPTPSDVVREFFARYERSRNTFDTDLIETQYPEAFMFAGPKGARVTEKRAVREALSKGRELFQRLGHTSTTLESLDETRLDEHYTMVRARLVWHFEKASTPPVDVAVDAVFVLYINDGAATIVFQQEREEFQQALRDRGVLS